MNVAQGSLVADLVAFILGLIVNALFLYPVGMDSRRGFKNNTDLICFLLVAFEFVWSLAGIPLTLIPLMNGIQTGFDGTWGKELCAAQGIGIAISISVLPSIHALLAIDRYVQFHWVKKLTHLEMLGVFSLFGGTFLGILAYDMSLPRPWQVWDSNAICFFVIQSDDIHEKIPEILVIVYCFVWVSVMIACYGSIFVTLNKTQKTLVGMHVATNKQQKILLNRCLIILGATLISYGPNLLAFTYKAITNEPIPGLVDALLDLLELFDGIITPILLLYVNKRNWRAFQKYVLLKSAEDINATKTALILQSQEAKSTQSQNAPHSVSRN